MQKSRGRDEAGTGAIALPTPQASHWDYAGRRQGWGSWVWGLQGWGLGLGQGRAKLRPFVSLPFALLFILTWPVCRRCGGLRRAGARRIAGQGQGTRTKLEVWRLRLRGLGRWLGRRGVSAHYASAFLAPATCLSSPLVLRLLGRASVGHAASTGIAAHSTGTAPLSRERPQGRLLPA